MSSKQKRNYCTDATWLGRSDCKHCSIRNLMLFSGLPDSAFDDRLTHIDHFIFPAGSTLFEEGRDDGVIYSIRSGMVKLLSMMPGGEHRIVRMLGMGSAIGLEMLEQGNQYQHTAVALNDVDACRIPVKTIQTLEKSFPELCHQIRRTAAQAAGPCRPVDRGIKYRSGEKAYCAPATDDDRILA